MAALHIPTTLSRLRSSPAWYRSTAVEAKLPGGGPPAFGDRMSTPPSAVDRRGDEAPRPRSAVATSQHEWHAPVADGRRGRLDPRRVASADRDLDAVGGQRLRRGRARALRMRPRPRRVLPAIRDPCVATVVRSTTRTAGAARGGRETMDDDAIDDFHLDAIADADPYPYWYDDVDEPDSNLTLVRTVSCDLCIVGGGYTGLWTAIIAKERDPSRDVDPDRRPRGRLGCQRAQRRLHGEQPHPRRRQRAGPLPRRDRRARRARAEEPQRHRGGDQALRHRLRLRAHGCDRRRHDVAQRVVPRRAARRLPAVARRSARRSSCSTARQCAPRSTRRRTPVGCGARTAPRSSIRRGWCGG